MTAPTSGAAPVPPTPQQIAAALVTPEYARLARSGLSVSQLGTWGQSLPRDDRLLVPIDVQALVVTPAAGQQAVPTQTVVPIPPPGSPLSAGLPIPPQPFGPPVARPPGVHLHWAMPDGLTKGDAGAARSEPVPAGNPTGLPPLPDRWVVVRLVAGATTVRCFVLLADRGEHHDLAGWTDPGPPPPGQLAGATGQRIIPAAGLTAVAGGDHAWAATYDAVLDRFAFYDDLSDLGAAGNPGLALSYLVAGWWSEGANDPLADCTTVGDYQQRASWLGWLAPEPDRLTDSTLTGQVQRAGREVLGLASPPLAHTGRMTEQLGTDQIGEITMARADLLDPQAALALADGPAMPRQTLLHGMVAGVSLAAGQLDLAPAPAALSAAIGPSGYAALSALLAEGGTAEQRISSERLLAAFAGGLLPVIDQPDGLAAVDEDRHSGGFTARQTGTRDRPDRVAEGDVMTGDRSAPAPPANTAAAGLGGPAQRKQAAIRAILLPREMPSVLQSSLAARFGADQLGTGSQPAPRTFRDIAVPLPRVYTPNDLGVVIRGAVRSFRHGGDGRYTPDGRLACRLPSQVVRGISGVLDGGQLPAGLRTVGSGAVPAEVDLLLQEAALTDPYRWPEQVGWSVAARGLAAAPVATRIQAELALRNAFTAPSRGLVPELDTGVADTVRQASLWEGDDVSPVGLTRWAQPWVPLWCDWEVSLAVDGSLDRWTLGPIELETGSAPDAATARVIQGRTPLVSAAARALAAQIRQWLADESSRETAGQGQTSGTDDAALAAAAAAADGQDVLAGTLRGIREALLGLDPVDAARAAVDSSGTPTTKPTARAVPLLLAGGAATITRLRVVDAFGRWVDLPAQALPAMGVATTNSHPNGPPAIGLPPRFQRPSSVALRFVDPATPDGAPDVEAFVDQQHPDQQVSPVCGWLLPDHVDAALEFFDPSGLALGMLRHDDITGAVVWEGAPGRPGPIGAPPDPGPDPAARHVTRLAAGAVTADAAARNDPAGAPSESALAALLRAVDTTLWTVDPLGTIGTGSVAGLVGRPIAVIRAILRLDVLDDLDELTYATPADRAARAQAYLDLAARAITVRLGELTRTDDSLLAYAVDDDYRTLRLVAPEVRSQARVSGPLAGQLAAYGRGSQELPAVVPITHPYLSGPTDVSLHPGQTVRLTLLMNPGGRVHVTTGVLPRKALALARDWFYRGLTALSPSFRFGPVLVDPTTVRLPTVTGLGDHQEFTHRVTPDSWRDDPIAAATQTAYLPDQPATLQEGWIRVAQAVSAGEAASSGGGGSSGGAGSGGAGSGGGGSGGGGSGGGGSGGGGSGGAGAGGAGSGGATSGGTP